MVQGSGKRERRERESAGEEELFFWGREGAFVEGERRRREREKQRG